MNKIDVLNRCTIDGYVVKLPDIILDKPLYNEVAKDLKMIGGNDGVCAVYSMAHYTVLWVDFS